MGVKGISKIVKKFGKKYSNLEFMKGKRIAIDASIFLYRFKYNTVTTQAFIQKFHAQIKLFIDNEITPIYVFDGVPPEIKQVTLDSREKTRNQAVLLADLEKDPEKVEKIMKNVIRVTKEDKLNLKEFFDMNGVKYICPEATEGEKFCAYLDKTNQVDFVLSNDYDSIAFGCTNLVFTNNDSTYTLYNTQTILSELNGGISQEDYIKMCIASGCDYYPQGIKNFGPSKSLAAIKKRVPFENWPGNDIPKETVETMMKIFLEDPQEVID